MKHGRRPTRAQKIYIKWCGFNPANWLVVSENGEELLLTHRYTGTVRVLPIRKGRCTA
mgnify:CR=1 FL=1